MGLALVVDDSKTILEMLAKCLTQDGLTVMTATNGADALSQLNAQTPDIIVLDVVLPDRSGFELCREFKSDPRMNDIPIIFCSSKGTDLDKFWGLRQGASAYLVKPLVPEELIDIINQLTKNQQEQQGDR